MPGKAWNPGFQPGMNMTMENTPYIAGLLKRTGLFTDDQVERVLLGVREQGLPIVRAVVDGGHADESAFLEALAGVLNLPYRRIEPSQVPREVLEKMPPRAVFQYNIMPVAMVNGSLEVATADPLDAGLTDALRLASGLRIRLVLCPARDITEAAKALYGVGAETVDRMMRDTRFEELQAPGKLELGELDQEASIVKFVNQIIWEAFREGATDIHFEPMELELRIRYRVDGVLHATPVPAQLNRFQAAIISRIKVMASLDIAEKRMPMDGRISLRVDAQDVDIRVSTMPTVYGESVSLRLLQRHGSFITIRELGMAERDCVTIERIIHRPNGIILVTGPTGSGKTTSLYAYLNEVNSMDLRILTAEEPIEYEMSGINQVLVRPDIGLTFATVLRAFLRQDPDIIMVGEIRDFETAEIAIQASLTGHLVFSTLHTNDAAGAFTRLLDMGVEPYLAASAVEAVIAQRLVRKLCVSCRQPLAADRAELAAAGFPVDRLEGAVLYGAGQCEKCRKTGFHGRGGIFEVLEATESIESLVIGRRPTNEIRQRAMQHGMRSLRDDGWEKVLAGMTTIEEVIRATEENE